VHLFKQVKEIFDPLYIFNAGKIVDTPPMDQHLRIAQDVEQHHQKTYFDFGEQGGILHLAEKCSGSGDCRRSEVSKGLMCPSYMATRNEFDTTRARANMLRQFLSNPNDSAPLTHEEINEVMDLCLSCKGCKVDCPSGVDITKMKAEFLQQYYDKKGIPLRARLIAGFTQQMKLASMAPWFYNTIMGVAPLRRVMNNLIGFHPDRSMPSISKVSLKKWHKKRVKSSSTYKKVFLFCDEFTNYLDTSIGQKTVALLEKLGYDVIIPYHLESARSYLSKGLVKQATAIIQKNITLLSPLVSDQTPLIGIEPSAILTLRDEYKDLAGKDLREKAIELASHTYTIEEFLYREMQSGSISRDIFTKEKKSILLHAHCYQKVLSSSSYAAFILSFPENFEVEEIPSGCCGMAGSFGYEKEHFDVSQKIGELVLFPAIRNKKSNAIIAASGTSCRHQIKDGVNEVALHPVEILYDALRA
jgi:Fe-S oxidoreductase